MTAVVLLFGSGGAWAADPYLCYTGAYAKGETKLVAPFPSKELKDQLEDLSYDAKKPIWECNPATTVSAGTSTDPSNPTLHLEGYQIALTKTPVKQVELKNRLALVRDQFGELPLKVTAPESVDVRTSKTLLAEPPVACSATKPCTAPATCLASAGVCVSDSGHPAPPPIPTPPATSAIDNYKCYKVSLQPGFKFTKLVNAIQAKDEFGGMCTAGDPTKLNSFCQSDAACDGPTPTVGNGVCGPIGYDVVKPTRLCMPVDKANEDPGAETHTDHLMCYQVAVTKPLPPLKAPKFPKALVANSNGNFPDDRLNVTALKELCVPAKKELYYCGDGVTTQPFEDCDAPKVCQGGATPGAPCTGNTQCGGGTCVANLACPNAAGTPNTVACSKTCQCPMISGPQSYHVSDFAMKITAGIASTGLGNQLISFDLSSSDAGAGETTLTAVVGDPDASGNRTLSVDKASWLFDTTVINTTLSGVPLSLSVRLCLDANATGTLYTKSNVGDVDYTATTTSVDTTYVLGDGKKDKAGSASMDTTLRADLYIGDQSCTGDGLDTSCLACDGSTAPAGRIGISAFAGPMGDGNADLSLSLETKLSTGNVEDQVNQAGNQIDGSEIKGHGYLTTGRSLRLGAATGRLGIPANLLGNDITLNAQIFASESFSPAP